MKPYFVLLLLLALCLIFNCVVILLTPTLERAQEWSNIQWLNIYWLKTIFFLAPFAGSFILGMITRKTLFDTIKASLIISLLAPALLVVFFGKSS